jgi:glycosyltransferase involved in cell wall biosynthesis
MNILYIHQYFNTPTMHGSTRSYEFAKRLVAKGNTVYMITTDWQGTSNKYYSIIEGIHVYSAPIKYSNKMSYFKRLFIFSNFIFYAFYMGCKLKYDLIIASSTPLTVGLPGILLKRLKNVKMIFEVRDLWPQLPVAIGAIRSKLLIRVAKWLEKIIYKNSNHIICLSSGMQFELKLRLPSSKITVITNLSDIDKFQNNKQIGYLNKKIPEIEKNPIILYSGVFGRINGVDYIVEIANEMKKINPNIYFLLVGNGFAKDEIMIKSKKYEILNKNLFYLNYLPKNEMPKLLSCATIVSSLFIDIPEMVNNSANKFFDGLAAGKPIMINYGGWQKELLVNSGAGFIIPKRDAKLAAKQINNIIINKTILKNMSSSSLKTANKFDIKTNYEKFERVINNVYQN